VAVTTLQASLGSINLEEILSILCSIKPSERTKETTVSLFRAVERIRRFVKTLDTKAPETSTAWLKNYVQFALRLIPDIGSSDVVLECMPGLVETGAILMRRNTPECNAISLEDLDAIIATLASHGADLDVKVQTQYASALIHSAYNVALAFSKIALEPAVAFCRRSCEWAQAFLARVGDVDEVVRKVVSGPISKRYELLGFCLQKGGHKAAALHAFIQGCFFFDSGAAKQVAVAAASKPLRLVFADMPEFNAMLKRTASLLAHEADLGPDFSTLLTNELINKQWSPAVTGALLEQVFVALEHSQFLPHVQDALVSALNMALNVYDAETYPVRRLRVISRFVSIIISTGAAADQYESLTKEADVLSTVKELGKDASLAKYRQEYYATIVIHAALQTYHHPESSPGLAELGRAALDASRAFLFPAPPAAAKRTAATRGKTPAMKPRAPAKTTTTRKVTPTAAKKAAATAPVDAPPPIELDDIERFSGLLNALASLFGLLGYIVPKIEALNLLRAMQRANMPDAFIATSSQVAAEYGRLGKYSRAGQVFAKALKQADDAAPVAGAELHLRHARFLATGGHLHQARAEYAAAARLADQMLQVEPVGTYAERWVQICAAMERMALAHSAAAAIKMAEEEVTAAMSHLVSAYRLWGRAAHGIAQIAAAAPPEAAVAEEPTTNEPVADTPAAETVAKSKQKPFCFVGKRLGGLQWYFAEVSCWELTKADSRRSSRRSSISHSSSGSRAPSRSASTTSSRLMAWLTQCTRQLSTPVRPRAPPSLRRAGCTLTKPSSGSTTPSPSSRWMAPRRSRSSASRANCSRVRRRG
jgi:separase